MGMLKAKRAFYNDAVGTRAQGEVFEVRNAELCNQLEQQGYAEKVEGEASQANQEKLQEQMGKKQALTNEAVSMSHHVQNQEANQHTKNVNEELKQKQQRSNQDQAQQQQQNKQEQHQAATPKQAAKKANEK